MLITAAQPPCQKKGRQSYGSFCGGPVELLAFIWKFEKVQNARSCFLKWKLVY